MVKEPGRYEMSMEKYKGKGVCVSPCLSRSVIKDLLFKSPYHAWYGHPDLNPDWEPEESNGKFDVGTFSHALLLQGEDNALVIDADDWRTKAAQGKREEARKGGKIPFLTCQYERTIDVVSAVERQIYGCKELGITDLRKDGKAEQSFFWKEGDTWFKIRPDWISNDGKLILDFKFTDMSANPEGIDRHVTSMGYEIQNSLYVRGVEAIQGHAPKFVFIFAECSAPFACSFIGLTPAFLDMGKQKVEFGKFVWEKCLRENKWPAYPNRVAYIEPPAWALASWESIGEKIGI